MKSFSSFPIILRIAACLILAAAAVRISSVMMDSLMSFRSPLRNDPPKPAASLGEPATRKLVFVIVDGLRVDTATDRAVMPNLYALRQQGASATLHSRTPSFSQPGFATLLTGAWPEINDSRVFNAPYEDIPTYTQDNLFSAADRAGLTTAISAFGWFEKLLPQNSVDFNFYTIFEDDRGDCEVVDAAAPWLVDSRIALILIHLDQMDYAGHYQGGPQSPAWNEAAKRVDGLIGAISAKLDLNEDTLLIVSDHGHVDQGNHGGHDPIVLKEPFILVGKGVRPGAYGDVSMTSVAPTVSALLGLNLPASAQAAPLTNLLDLPPASVPAIKSAYMVQQANLAQAYSQAIGVPLDQQLVSTGDYQAAIEAARATRLQKERLPRDVIAWILVMLPLFFIAGKNKRPWLLPIAGAGLYFMIFNLRYGLIDHNPYSFSALRSQPWVITYFLSTASISLLAAALLTAWLERWRLKTPAQAAARMLNLALTIIFFAAIPVLISYALNGLVIRWTLPDLASYYLALFSLIQIMLVALLSLPLAGATAAIVWLASRKSKPKTPGKQVADELL